MNKNEFELTVFIPVKEEPQRQVPVKMLFNKRGIEFHGSDKRRRPSKGFLEVIRSFNASLHRYGITETLKEFVPDLEKVIMNFK